MDDVMTRFQSSLAFTSSSTDMVSLMTSTSPAGTFMPCLSTSATTPSPALVMRTARVIGPFPVVSVSSKSMTLVSPLTSSTLGLSTTISGLSS